MDRIYRLPICLLLVFLLLPALESNAEMYKWKDSNGVTHFSDELPLDRQQAASEVESVNSAGAGEGVRINRFGMKFRYIKPGSFIMGSLYTKCCDDLIKKHPHRVTLTKGFYIQTTEVTQRQWSSIENINPSHFKDCGGDCPVEMVTWPDIQKFIAKLNKLDPENQYRLPTEAEWEYAARAGTTTKFGFGDDKKQLDDYGWYWYNSGDRTHTVAQKKPNRWGLYDMHGNVWEYCQDGYESYYYVSRKPVNDPIIKPNSPIHVLRSGSFRHCPNACWSASRCKDSTGKAAETTGFRLVLVSAN
jgi:formylglycine-generating enzyme required for sulfatase activity